MAFAVGARRIPCSRPLKSRKFPCVKAGWSEPLQRRPERAVHSESRARCVCLIRAFQPLVQAHVFILRILSTCKKKKKSRSWHFCRSVTCDSCIWKVLESTYSAFSLLLSPFQETRSSSESIISVPASSTSGSPSRVIYVSWRVGRRVVGGSGPRPLPGVPLGAGVYTAIGVQSRGSRHCYGAQAGADVVRLTQSLQ